MLFKELIFDARYLYVFDLIDNGFNDFNQIMNVLYAGDQITINARGLNEELKDELEHELKLIVERFMTECIVNRYVTVEQEEEPVSLNSWWSREIYKMTVRGKWLLHQLRAKSID